MGYLFNCPEENGKGIKWMVYADINAERKILRKEYLAMPTSLTR